ncbi:MAG: hypothetical protein HYZ22_08185 [Chloroflexi bacterium]|nr:hypothetical protein [Chloroflexota bacterium]
MNSREHRTYDLLWLSIALLPLIGLSFMLAVPAQDYWWYLRLGKDILEQGATPLVDTMGYSRAGEPIFYQQWLSGIIFYLVYQTGGVTLTFLLRAVLIGITYGSIWSLMRSHVGARTATILLIILGLATSNNWMIRPQLFAYPLFLLCLFAIYEWQKGNNRLLFLLPLSTLLWANLHGSFVLPFLLAGAALVFGAEKLELNTKDFLGALRGLGGSKKNQAMFFTILAMLVASLLNPHGLGVWQYLVFILNNPSDYLFSVEWRPPTNEGWQMNIFFVWMLVFPIAAAFSKQKLTWLEWVLFLGFGWLALSGVRYVIWFMFLLAIFTAKLVSEWSNAFVDKPIEKINPRTNMALAAMLFLVPLILLPGIRDSWWDGAPDLYELATTPIEAVEFLETHEDLPGPMWNDYSFGSYLEFMLPSRPTWMDTRMYSFPQAQWEEYVRVTNADGWQEMFDREGINLLLLSQAAQPALIEAVSSSPLWCEEYRDEYAVIYSRCEVK